MATKKLVKKTVTPGNISPTVTKEKGDAPANLVFHQLILRNIDRTAKDVGEWRIAHRMAEAVQNPNRRRLYNLFADVEMDATIRGTWQKRVSAVINKKIFFSRDSKKDEAFDALIKSKAFRTLRKKRMEEVSYGVVGFEFIPGAEFQWEEINRRHIRPEHHLITTEEDGYTGWDYSQSQNIIICEGDEPFGFLLYAAPYALFKKGNYSDWAQYVEIFGQPVIITKYDGYDEKTRILLTDALQAAGSSLRLMLPKQADFEMLDGKNQANGDGSLQDTFKNALNNELMILILGNTETTSNQDGGSYAKGKVHAEQQLEITKDDLEEELMFFNSAQMNTVMQMYGYNTEGGEWMYESIADADALKKDLEIDTGLEKLGLPLGDDYYYEKYQRPKPANYNELVTKKEQMRQQITGNDPNNPPEPTPPKNKKQNNDVQAALSGLSFWEKVKAVFSEAP